MQRLVDYKSAMDPLILKRQRPARSMFEVGTFLLLQEFQEIRREYAHMDLFGFNPGGESCEIEIKCSTGDLANEFVNKVEKHEKYKLNVGFVPNKFYFMVNYTVETYAIREIKLRKLPYGLIVYDGLYGKWREVIKPQRLSDLKFFGELNYYTWRDHRHKV